MSDAAPRNPWDQAAPVPPEAWPAPDLSPEASWEDYTPQPSHYKIGVGFVSGEPEGSRLRVRYYIRSSDKAMMAKVWFGPGAEGPPRHAHGGSIAAVLDEAMGRSAWIQGHRVLAGRLQIDYKRPLPLGRTAVVEARIERIDGRKVFTQASIAAKEGGEPYALGQGIFVILSAEKIMALIQAMGGVAPGGEENA